MITNEKLNELEASLSDDSVADKLGFKLAAMLRLKKRQNATDSTPRFQTAWGSKTDAGLARSIVRLIADELTV